MSHSGWSSSAHHLPDAAVNFSSRFSPAPRRTTDGAPIGLALSEQGVTMMDA